jgi:hypothetical protein
MLLFSANSTQAQKYFPLVVEGAKWHRVGDFEVHSYTDMGAHGIKHDYWYYNTEEIYSIGKDTIINDKRYNIISGTHLQHTYREGEIVSGGGSNYPSYTHDYYVNNNAIKAVKFYTREDSSKKVFIVYPSYNYIPDEKLYFDFGLKLHDVIPYNPDDYDSLYVNSIDSVLINNEYHKRFGVKLFTTNDTGRAFTNDVYSYIEGIGSLKGMDWGGFGTNVQSFDRGELKCFSINNSIIYQVEPKFNCDSFTVGIKQTVKNNLKFSVYPNPTNGQFTIQNQSIFSESDICVRDILGRIVLQEKLQGPNQTINISNQPNGLYFIELRSGNKRSVQKLILE